MIIWVRRVKRQWQLPGSGAVLCNFFDYIFGFEAIGGARLFDAHVANENVPLRKGDLISIYAL